MTIHIDLNNLNIRGPLPKERPVVRHPNAALLDNLISAILDDGDIEAYNGDGRPLAGTWRRIADLAERVSREG